MKLVFGLVFGLIILFTQTNPASAHILATDGSIGAVLHIDPNDDPIIKDPSNFYFDIKDKQGKFGFSKCECNIVIEKDNISVFQYTFPQDDYTLPGFTFIFPEKAVYKVIFTANPSTAYAFSSFRLIYDIRVDRQESGLTSAISQPLLHWQHYSIAGVSVITFALFYIIQKRKKRSKR